MRLQEPDISDSAPTPDVSTSSADGGEISYLEGSDAWRLAREKLNIRPRADSRLTGQALSESPGHSQEPNCAGGDLHNLPGQTFRLKSVAGLASLAATDPARSSSQAI